MAQHTTIDSWMNPSGLMSLMWKPWATGSGAFLMLGRSSLDFMENIMRQGDKLEERAGKAVNRTRESFGEMVTGVEKQVEQTVGQVGRVAQEEVEDLAESFESRVEQFIGQLGVPTRSDFDALINRFDLLEAELNSVRSERITYHVVPDDDGWAVKISGDDTILSHHELKDEAVNSAREMAHTNEPSHVVVHRKDGTIQAHHNYGKDEG